MPAPKVSLTITEQPPRRGAPTDTGTALWAFTASGLSAVDPVVVRSAPDAAAAFPEPANAQIVQWVGDYFTTARGVGSVVLVRAAAAAAAATAAEWTSALSKLSVDYGPGQVAIPGVTTAAATSALSTHLAAHPERAGLIEGGQSTSTSDLLNAANAIGVGSGSPATPDPSALRMGIVGPYVPVSAPAGTQRMVPGTVLACGLVARNDAFNGHANNMPIIDQGRGAGVISQGLGVSAVYSDTDRDTLNDAGVNLIRMRQGVPTLYGWRSCSQTSLFRQFNAGRFIAQLSATLPGVMEQFLGQGIDGVGGIYADVYNALDAYLTLQWRRGALYGATAADAYSITVAPVNTVADAAAGRVNAQVVLRITRSTELIVLNVSVTTAEGSVAA